MDANLDFYKKRHVKFFARCLDVLPNAYQTLDTNRMTVSKMGIVFDKDAMMCKQLSAHRFTRALFSCSLLLFHPFYISRIARIARRSK